MFTEPQIRKYELWSSADESSDSFFPADSGRADHGKADHGRADHGKADSGREGLAPDARLVCVIEAASWNEAQQKRYDLMGWGHYRTFEEEERQSP